MMSAYCMLSVPKDNQYYFGYNLKVLWLQETLAMPTSAYVGFADSTMYWIFHRPFTRLDFNATEAFLHSC